MSEEKSKVTKIRIVLSDNDDNTVADEVFVDGEMKQLAQALFKLVEEEKQKRYSETHNPFNGKPEHKLNSKQVDEGLVWVCERCGVETESLSEKSTEFVAKISLAAKQIDCVGETREPLFPVKEFQETKTSNDLLDQIISGLLENQSGDGE